MSLDMHMVVIRLFLLLLLVSSLEAFRVGYRFASSSQNILHILNAGFGKSATKVEERVFMPPIADSLCACGSQKSYGDCCKQYHDGAITSSPIALARARFSAFVTGFIPYLMRSTHPDSRDYATDDEENVGSKRSKRTIWMKSLLAFAEDYEFSNLKIVSDENKINIAVAAAEKDATVAVDLALDRKPKSSMKVENCAELFTAKRVGDSDQWLYLSGKTDIVSGGDPNKPKKIKYKLMN